MIEIGGSERFEIPTVVTDRLVLRAWASADIAPYAHWASDLAMSRYTGSPQGEAEVWRMEALQLGHWALRGFGMWAMEDRNNGEMIGRAGLYEGPGWPGVEVAWTVAYPRWGEGLATEAGAAALWFAFAHLGLDRVVSLMHRDNAASRRVAEKLGLALERMFFAPMFDNVPTCQYWISRTEWTDPAV